MISGIELVGLISAIISILQASIEVYNGVSSSSDLPPSFRDVALRLPLILDTLRIAQEGLIDNESDESLESLRSCLEICQQKSLELERTFRDLLLPAHASRVVRLYNALKATMKADKVRDLGKGISEDLQALTANHAIQATTRSQMKKLMRKLEEGYVSYNGPSISMRNIGPGNQVSYSGIGNQNISAGSQVNGVFHGSFTFTSTADRP